MSEVNWTKEERELEGALCAFCNAASDAWLPSEWAKETERNFIRLAKAYDAWYDAKTKSASHDPVEPMEGER